MVICFILRGGIIQQDWFCSGSHNFVPWELLPAIWHPTILFYSWTPGSLGHLMIGLLSPRIYYFSGTSWLLSLETGMDVAVCTCSCLMSVLFRWRKHELRGTGFLSCRGSVIVCNPSVSTPGIFTFCSVTAHTGVQVINQRCPPPVFPHIFAEGRLYPRALDVSLLCIGSLSVALSL